MPKPSASAVAPQADDSAETPKTRKRAPRKADGASETPAAAAPAPASAPAASPPTTRPAPSSPPPMMRAAPPIAPREPAPGSEQRQPEPRPQPPAREPQQSSQPPQQQSQQAYPPREQQGGGYRDREQGGGYRGDRDQGGYRDRDQGYRGDRGDRNDRGDRGGDRGERSERGERDQGGGGGGQYRDRDQGQRPPYQGQQGGGGGYQGGGNPRPMNQGGPGYGGGGGGYQGGGMMGPGGRKKKKKKKFGSGGHMGHHAPSFHIGALPSDDDLDREAQELSKIAQTKEYQEAEKNALHVSKLQRMALNDLHAFAEKEGITDFHALPRQELIFNILKKRASENALMFGEGTLEILPEGYGFLRSPEASYLSSPEDIYVAPAIIRRLGLRKGMEIQGAIRPPKDANEKFFALLRVDKVNNGDPSRIRNLPIFEDLTPLHPEQRYVLETTQDQIEMRVIDLVAPIGRGQRGLIVAPPRTGKTVIMQKITQAISKNYPDVKIIVLLIDERPEEVTDFRRNTAPEVEVVASTFDEDSSRHVQVTEMVMEKSRRYVEFGQHVVILLDSITRLARAYNAAQPHSGKIMSGGIDSNALIRPKKFFGSARAIEKGGSLTILGTALVDTGSKADEVIFEEFKGTGNSELHLDRKLVEKRIYPAIDVAASGTRREELLLDPKELELVYRLRKVLSDMNVVEAMELLKTRLKKSKTNAEFLMTMNLG